MQAGAVSANLAGGVALNKTTAGTVTLSGTNSYTGVTTVSAGTLQANLASSLSGYTTSGKVIFDGGTIATPTGNGSTTGWTGAQIDTLLANATMTSGALAINTSNTSISLNAFSGGIGLAKLGANTLTLTGENTYTGVTTVTAGALVIGSSGSLHSGNALSVGASGTADFQNAGQTLGAVSNANTASNALHFSANTGTVTLDSLTGTGQTTFGSNAIVTGGISTGTVASVGDLTANISGGTTTVGGVATIDTMSAGTANLNGATSTITTLNGGTLNLGGTTALTVSAGTTSGAITGAGGSLTKNTTGTLTLNGTHTYTGATVVSAGTLVIGTTGTINSTSAVTVAAGATLVYNSSTSLTVAPTLNGSGTANRAVLAGSGTIGGAMTMNDVGNTLSPGNSPGTLSFTSAQTWSKFSYDWQVNNFTGTTAGVDFDQVAIGSTLALNEVSGSYVLNVLGLTAENTAGLVPNFSSIDQSWTILTTTGLTHFDATKWTINTTGFTDPNTGSWSVGQTGNNLVLTFSAVPEPDVAALLGGLGTLLLLRRRRR